jgi:hypothetical protein
VHEGPTVHFSLHFLGEPLSGTSTSLPSHPWAQGPDLLADSTLTAVPTNTSHVVVSVGLLYSLDPHSHGQCRTLMLASSITNTNGFGSSLMTKEPTATQGDCLPMVGTLTVQQG